MPRYTERDPYYTLESITPQMAAQVLTYNIPEADRASKVASVISPETPTVPQAKGLTQADIDAAIAAARAQWEADNKAKGPSADQRSAFAMLKDQLAEWGLEGLTDWAIQLYQGENAPVSYNEFYSLMKQQPIYQERFGKTNAERTKMGLPQLTENEIMKLESQYRNIMKSYNLPANFYDSPEDYRKFIVNDLSAAELADRVQAANAYVKIQDKGLRDQLRQYYGIDDSALAAYALDPAKGQQVLSDLASKTTARIAAATAGLGEAEAKLAMGMGAEEMSFAKQAQAFGQSAQAGTEGAKLSAIYGGQGAQKYGTTEAIGEFFGGATAPAEAQKRRKLARMEENVFGGGSGAGAGSLGGGSVAGAI